MLIFLLILCLFSLPSTGNENDIENVIDRLKQRQIPKLSDVETALITDVKPNLYEKIQSDNNRRLGRRPNLFEQTKKTEIKESDFEEISITLNGNTFYLIQPKGISDYSDKIIIVNHYGGFQKGDFDYQRRTFLDMKHFLEKGYLFIQIPTKDKDQTAIHQADQVDINNEQGLKLLDETIAEFINYVREFKKDERFQKSHLVYYGASFGGFKGGFINLLLSNGDQRHNMIEPNVYDKMTEIQSLKLNASDKELFIGFILHDGAFDYINSFIRSNEYKSSIPLLLLHNFDDERVNVAETLVFYNQLKKSGTNMRFVKLFITPQGAKFEMQSENTHGSTEGHFTPKSQEYQIEYWQIIYEFIRNITQHQSVDFMSKARFIHANKLYSGNASIEMTEDEENVLLYRLYYAFLKETQNHGLYGPLKGESQEDRIYATFVILAAYLDQRNEGHYILLLMDLIERKTEWLLNTIRDTQKNRLQNLNRDHIIHASSADKKDESFKLNNNKEKKLLELASNFIKDSTPCDIEHGHLKQLTDLYKKGYRLNLDVFDILYKKVTTCQLDLQYAFFNDLLIAMVKNGENVLSYLGTFNTEKYNDELSQSSLDLKELLIGAPHTFEQICEYIRSVDPKDIKSVHINLLDALYMEGKKIDSVTLKLFYDKLKQSTLNVTEELNKYPDLFAILKK